jgi:Cu(I)/Ag(I) efflux system membrane fusion protein
MNVTGAMIEQLRPVADNLEALDSSRHFHGFDDIKSARIAYHKFILAAVVVLEPLRTSGPTPEFEIYECGMVDDAIPGVPKKARWIQTGKRPLSNPFFGADMLTCGKEILR